jgi:hypothetical protein
MSIHSPKPLMEALISSKKSIEDGYVLLTSVIILGAVGVVVAASLLLGGSSATKTSLLAQQSAIASVYAENCSELALDRIRSDASYSGTTTINFPDGMCSYVVTTTSATTRDVNATGIVGSISRKHKVVIGNLGPPITITSWKDVADF